MPKSKTKTEPVTYAFIDSQNLNLGIRELGWKLDNQRFRIYLKEKYNVTKAFLFIGYMPQNADLYTFLQEAGFICIFRPTLTYRDGTTKGNCDAELVLNAMIQFPNYEKAIIVSGDGDFQCLAKYLFEQDKLSAIMVPNQQKYSGLLKFDIFKPYLRFVSDLRSKLAYLPKKKSPREDKNSKGTSSIGDESIVAKKGSTVKKNNSGRKLKNNEK
jgi:uncharacterized LabA/DUF88 family protein